LTWGAAVSRTAAQTVRSNIQAGISTAAGVRTAQRAAEHNLVRLADRLMNGDAMRKPRMPGVQELTEYRPMGVLECCSITKSASTRAWTIARRVRPTKQNARGYVDDRLRRPAAPSPTGCAFAHIPTGTTANHRIDIDEGEGRSSVVPSAIGADTEIGRATP
jgi:hypothetical protein